MSKRGPYVLGNQKVSSHEKNKEKKKWYKHQVDALDVEGNSYTYNHGDNGITEYHRKKVNYELFNGILDLSDFEYVCQPFGAEQGELPAQMVNRDISSSRVKAILGLEMKRPFSWRAMAVNKEATTRKEQEEFNRIRDYVVSEIMTPISQQIEVQYQQQLSEKELSQDQRNQIQEQIASELKASTPDKVRKYMERDHQDPAEVLSNHILHYLIQEQQIKRKFNKGFKHGLLAAEEIYWTGILNGRPTVRVINPIRFSYDKSPDVEFIEDGEWATYEYRMHPSEVVKYFGDQLTPTEIDKVYENADQYGDDVYSQDLFNFNDNEDPEYNHNTNRVLHAVWKSLRKIGFLTYLDQEGNEQQDIVSEEYDFSKEDGDLHIEWEWIPEVYEGYKIDSDIYVNLRPVPGQFKDIYNLYECKLPYIGVVYDNINARPTSLMDRMKVYQYYYNIVMYRLELLIASDKGKKLLMNINSVPKNSGIDIKKWQYFFESTPFAWFNPSEEGNPYGDVNTVGKVVDMSLASDIAKYIEIAEFLEQKLGKSVGITDITLGDISPSQEVGTTRQAVVQTSHILEPYFEAHTSVKRNVLQSLLQVAKVAYIQNPPESLNYTLDDMSLITLEVDTGLLDDSTVGIFISDGARDAEVQENMKQLAHAAMQNQLVELSDVVSIIRQKDSQEAEEILKASEEKRRGREEQSAKAEREFNAQQEELRRQEAETEHERKKELIILEESEKRKTDIQKQAMLSIGFNEDKDVDNDGELDVLEIAKHNVDADIKISKQKLDEQKFEQSKKEHEDKQKLEKQKLNKANTKK